MFDIFSHEQKTISSLTVQQNEILITRFNFPLDAFEIICLKKILLRLKRYCWCSCRHGWRWCQHITRWVILYLFLWLIHNIHTICISKFRYYYTFNATEGSRSKLYGIPRWRGLNFDILEITGSTVFNTLWLVTGQRHGGQGRLTVSSKTEFLIHWEWIKSDIITVTEFLVAQAWEVPMVIPHLNRITILILDFQFELQ